jgi:hypothetical protein
VGAAEQVCLVVIQRDHPRCEGLTEIVAKRLVERLERAASSS